jgi:hypothetical protein
MFINEVKRKFEYFIFSSFNENPIQQPSLRSNRTENPTPLRSRERENEQNLSRRSGNKPGPMTTTSTSPIPQRSTRINEDNKQKSS